MNQLKVIPDFKTFCRLARRGNLVPMFTEFLADMETPVSACIKLDRGEEFFLLESVEGSEKWATYSFLGLEPRLIFSCKGQEVEIRNGKKTKRRVVKNNPLDVLKKELAKYRPVTVKGIPRFHGGAVGFVGYDGVRYYENLSNRHPERHGLPDAFFFITDTLIVFNNLRHQIQVIVNVIIPAGAKQAKLKKLYDKGVRRLHELKQRVQSPSPLAAPDKKRAAKGGGTLHMAIPKAKFLKMVEKAKTYIEDGDIIQVVLSNSFEGQTQLSPLKIYRALRMLNPSPYLYYFRARDFAIVGSSPETLVRLEGDEITVRPIAGTRPRGRNEKEDQNLARELLGDAKERAEHVMLVDLGRNDIGRVAANGSVQVKELMNVERYSHVMHLTSHVTGKLKAGCNAFDVFGATFPAGTLTGAPKIRAMEIIEELEPSRRGPYGGALGYFSFSGNMDFCITIRTLVLTKNRFYVQAGAGIVADSKPANEFEESRNKAKAVLKAMELAKKIDS